MRFNTFFFDLDETLYPSSSGLWVEIRGRINAYMHERMGFTPEQIEAVREKYFQEYGTTLRGLQANHQVDMDDYLAFVHTVPLDAYLRPDPELRAALMSIPARKFIFTNADCAHAGRVTNALGLDGVFDGCIDVHVIAPYCKPMPESFQLALAAAGNPDPHKCVLLDDQGRITRAARALGMYTVLVGKDSPGFVADEALVNLAELPALTKYWRL
ncbi:MAG: putative hydrolase of the HAD superfamily [Anaerolineaceae bacterium]|nr:MAG: putative hydrolase of the HAD superfamily [Anaerolineaceae bacterium]